MSGEERTIKLSCSTLVLDLDGTISDPSLGIGRCFNHALEQHGFATVSDSAIRRQIGPPLDEGFMELTGSFDPALITQLVVTYRERYSEVGFSENTLYPAIPEALERIKAGGTRLGVCTSKRADFARKILSLFNLLDYFDFVDGGDVGITKQSQLAGLLSSGAIDEQAIMVGDRAIDITSATGNGLRSIGVLWGFGDHEELSQASPSAILSEIGALADVIA